MTETDPKKVLSKSAIEEIIDPINEVAFQNVGKVTSNVVVRFVPMGGFDVPMHIQKKVDDDRVNVARVEDKQYIFAPFSKNIIGRLWINEMVGPLEVNVRHEGDHDLACDLLFEFLNTYNLTPIQTNLVRQQYVLAKQVSDQISNA